MIACKHSEYAVSDHFIEVSKEVGKIEANNAHYEVAEKIRNAMMEMGAALPCVYPMESRSNRVKLNRAAFGRPVHALTWEL
jgi:hypothetical protein